MERSEQSRVEENLGPLLAIYLSTAARATDPLLLHTYSDRHDEKVGFGNLEIRKEGGRKEAREIQSCKTN